MMAFLNDDTLGVNGSNDIFCYCVWRSYYISFVPLIKPDYKPGEGNFVYATKTHAVLQENIILQICYKIIRELFSQRRDENCRGRWKHEFG